MSNFWDLINIDEYWDKREQFNEDRGDISFYCKDCKEIVETTRPKANEYSFICNKCESTNTVIWTLEWLKSNYRIK